VPRLVEGFRCASLVWRASAVPRLVEGFRCASLGGGLPLVHRSILQLSDDDSTSITKLEEGKKRRENGQRVALASVCPEGD